MPNSDARHNPFAKPGLESHPTAAVKTYAGPKTPASYPKDFPASDYEILLKYWRHDQLQDLTTEKLFEHLNIVRQANRIQPDPRLDPRCLEPRNGPNPPLNQGGNKRSLDSSTNEAAKYSRNDGGGSTPIPMDQSTSDPPPTPTPTPGAALPWPPRTPANKKPPPVMIDAPEDNFHLLMTTLQSRLVYQLRAETKYTTVELSCFDLVDYDVLVSCLDNVSLAACGEKLQYHTYTAKSRRQLRMVLRPLPTSVSDDDIKKALTEAGLPAPLLVRRLPRGTVGVNKESAFTALPVPSLSVLVGFPAGTEVAKVKKVNTLLYCAVEWQRPNPKPIRTNGLCRKCGRTGHLASGCSHEEKCLHCATSHPPGACTKEKPSCTVCKAEGHSSLDRQEARDPAGKLVTIPVCPRLQQQVQQNLERDTAFKERHEARRNQPRPQRRQGPTESKVSEEFPPLPTATVLIKGFQPLREDNSKHPVDPLRGRTRTRSRTRSAGSRSRSRSRSRPGSRGRKRHRKSPEHQKTPTHPADGKVTFSHSVTHPGSQPASVLSGNKSPPRPSTDKHRAELSRILDALKRNPATLHPEVSPLQALAAVTAAWSTICSRASREEQIVSISNLAEFLFLGKDLPVNQDLH